MSRLSSAVRQWRSAVPVAVVFTTALTVTACGGSKSKPVALSPEAAKAVSLAKDKGCLACHSTDGTRRAMGPTWKGIFGTRRDMIDGTSVIADEAYIRLSITNPSVQRLATANTVMPQISLSEEELNILVSYISTL